MKMPPTTSRRASRPRSRSMTRLLRRHAWSAPLALLQHEDIARPCVTEPERSPVDGHPVGLQARDPKRIKDLAGLGVQTEQDALVCISTPEGGQAACRAPGTAALVIRHRRRGQHTGRVDPQAPEIIGLPGHSKGAIAVGRDLVENPTGRRIQLEDPAGTRDIAPEVSIAPLETMGRARLRTRAWRGNRRDLAACLRIVADQLIAKGRRDPDAARRIDRDAASMLAARLELA